jgi:predicted nucleic acid-binding protein
LNGSFVLDASLVLSWCFRDEQTSLSTHVLKLLKTDRAIAPALLPFELASGLRIAERRGRITSEEQQIFLEILQRLPIAIDERPLVWLCQQIIPVSQRYGVTAYDAAYLELAIREGLPLATLDTQLQLAADKAGIQVLGLP